MSGVALYVARSPMTEEMIGFSLQRVIADEAELLLLAVAPPLAAVAGSAARCLVNSSTMHAHAARTASTLKFVTEIRRSGCIAWPGSTWPAGAANIITGPATNCSMP